MNVALIELSNNGLSQFSNMISNEPSIIDWFVGIGTLLLAIVALYSILQELEKHFLKHHSLEELV
ncbi:MAG: hypothetical protein ABIC91_03595 [Nanoarchaeota archaeon]|nr:hypothetical protein [Nanoarchaeota archaeon]MBU1029628.1 hypothetical protein [Nanoarchaeota archaeon]MBU1850083.1 hypothetical protein [Nanoarchaeota archaeon]